MRVLELTAVFALLSTAHSLVIPSVITVNNHAEKPAEQFTEISSHELTKRTSLSQAPLYNHSNPIPNRYIVAFKDGVDSAAISSHTSWLKSVISSQTKRDDSLGGLPSSINAIFDWTSLFNGYVGTFIEDVVSDIRSRDDVAFVEQDVYVNVSSTTTQDGAPWGLARLSTRESLNGSDTGKYVYDGDVTADVSVYVIDTGIYLGHQDFGGRATWGVAVSDYNSTDDNGHGTHVAGTIGSTTYGVAKSANLVAVKVFGGSGIGPLSDVVSGVSWVVAQHNNGNSSEGGTVINMSMEVSQSTSLDNAVKAAYSAGIHVAAPAGNNNGADACDYSPGSIDEILTVGASDSNDTRASFSNIGSCVDIFAPGVNVLSTWTSSDTATEALSGTSMATPHISGLLAYFLSLQPGANSSFSSGKVSPASLKKAVLNYATNGAISDAGSGSSNKFPYNGAGMDLSLFWLGAA